MTDPAHPHECDVAVIGNGIAGLSAAFVAARYGRSTMLFGSLAGGELITLDEIEDYPGIAKPIAGYELCPIVFEQATAAGARVTLEEVDRLQAVGGGFEVHHSSGSLTARSVVIATGAEFATLGIPGEESLAGHGISHCASCDGPIHSGGQVGVLGNGDHAVQQAVTLARFAASVTVFCPDAQLTAQQVYLDRLAAEPVITVLPDTRVLSVLGEQVVTGVTVRSDSGAQARHELTGLFVYAGQRPRVDLAAGLLELDTGGHIVTDARMATSVAGIFAAGDVRANAAGHAISSAGDGATAAVWADRYLAGSFDPSLA